MSEGMIGESQEIDTPATQEAPQGELPNTPESAPEPNTEADTAEQPEEDHKVPKGVQKRIDRLTRERYRLQGELDAIRRQQVQPQAAQAPSSSEGAPTPDQFQSYEQYLEAKAEWKAEQKVSEVLRRQQESTRQQSAQAEQAKLRATWEQRVDAASDAYDDFDEVALAPDLPISGPMAEAIQRAEKGADVLYYLGKHRDVASQLASMDAFSAAIRIGEIAATLARPVPKKTTSAPPPINPVGARATAAKDPARMSDAEFAAWRREQIKKRN